MSSIASFPASGPVRPGVFSLSPAVLESICEYTDGQRADGVSYEAVSARLRQGGGDELAGLTAGEIERLHKAWQRGRMKELQVSRRRDVGVEELDLGAVALTGAGTSGWSEGEGHREHRGPGEGMMVEDDEAGEGRQVQFSDEVRELVRFLGRDLVQGRPCWQFARHRALRSGESFVRHRGPGELEGAEWRMGAVSIWRDGGAVLVEVLPEHRIKRVLPVCPPRHCSETLRLEVFTLSNVGRVKMAEALLEIQVRLGRKKLTERERDRLTRRKETLEARLASEGGPEAGAAVLRIQQTVSRLAVVMHLYVPEITGVKTGSELAAASGKSRAAISAAKLKLVEWDTGRTDGRSGFAGVRAVKAHRDSGRVKDGA